MIPQGVHETHSSATSCDPFRSLERNVGDGEGSELAIADGMEVDKDARTGCWYKNGEERFIKVGASPRIGGEKLAKRATSSDKAR